MTHLAEERHADLCPTVQGIPARQYDAWDLGMTTSDDFTAAEVQYEATLPAVRQALQMPHGGPPHIPVVTGFLGRGAKTGQLSAGISRTRDASQRCSVDMHAHHAKDMEGSPRTVLVSRWTRVSAVQAQDHHWTLRITGAPSALALA